MASKLFIINKYKPRFTYKVNLINKFIDKIKINDNVLPVNLNNNIKKRNKSISIFINKCIISGRSRAVLNKFKMSRMMFKRYGEFGYLNGVKKSTW
jgi:ribosomal protein S14